MKTSINIPRNIFYKSLILEYSRKFTGSILFLSFYNYFKEYPIIIRAPLTGCVMWSITYPIDSYKNILLSGYKNEKINITRLYNGIQYSFIRTIPSTIIGLHIYEYLNKILN